MQCGVIDVIPNATSRDEMGRAKVNHLNQFYINKYGPVDSIEYEQARVNFIQSMAAYSVICHLIQIRDRHNGNIMIDGRGCLVHIDFGFLFDIGPGGMRFEPFSFKLSNEMLEVMGGKNSEGYRQFRELTVKAYLACRPYAQAIAYTSDLMKEAGFPSYKDEGTVDRLKKRFRLDLTEKEAAEHMKALINDAELNIRSTMYDQIQKMQNGESQYRPSVAHSLIIPFRHSLRSLNIASSRFSSFFFANANSYISLQLIASVNNRRRQIEVLRMNCRDVIALYL